MIVFLKNRKRYWNELQKLRYEYNSDHCSIYLKPALCGKNIGCIFVCSYGHTGNGQLLKVVKNDQVILK